MKRQGSVLCDLKESRVGESFDRQRRKGSQTPPSKAALPEPSRDTGRHSGPYRRPRGAQVGGRRRGRALAGSLPGLRGGTAAPAAGGRVRARLRGRGRGRVAAVPPAEAVSRRAPRPPGPAGLSPAPRTLTRHGQQGPRAPPPSGLPPGLSAKAPPGGAGRGCMPATGAGASGAGRRRCRYAACAEARPTVTRLCRADEEPLWSSRSPGVLRAASPPSSPAKAWGDRPSLPGRLRRVRGAPRISGWT